MSGQSPPSQQISAEEVLIAAKQASEVNADDEAGTHSSHRSRTPLRAAIRSVIMSLLLQAILTASGLYFIRREKKYSDEFDFSWFEVQSQQGCVS
jgi:hypothetical protein